MLIVIEVSHQIDLEAVEGDVSSFMVLEYNRLKDQHYLLKLQVVYSMSITYRVQTTFICYFYLLFSQGFIDSTIYNSLVFFSLQAFARNKFLDCCCYLKAYTSFLFPLQHTVNFRTREVRP